MSSSLPSATMVADDVIDLLRVAVENIRHMQALFGAIKNDHKHGNHANTEQLADLGAYLGYDWGNYHEAQVARTEKDLRAAESSLKARSGFGGIPLADYSKGRPGAVAVQLGMTQAALNKAIRAGREIFILQHGDGTLAAVECIAFGATGFALRGGAQ